MRKKILIIAEAGVNHNGDLDMAKQLIKAAAHSGADIVKFQSFNPKLLSTNRAEKAQYQKNSSEASLSQLEMLSKLTLSPAAHKELISCCKENEIEFLSTAFDLESLDLLESLKLQIYKIPSGEITNLPYLRKIASLKKRIILSTGMATLSEVSDAIDALLLAGSPRENITILHCSSEYPAPMNEVNLLAMKSMKKTFGTEIGYSDHTLGVEVSIAAVALGATVIEKHFTLDKTLPGPDHKASATPEELRQLVSAIRNIEEALGDGIKRPMPSESCNRNPARKSIVALTPIQKGEPFSETNLGAKRPGNGISPMRWDEILGKLAPCSFEPDDPIHL